MKKALAYVEEHEADEAKALIDKQFTELTGSPFDYRTAGYLITCKIWIRPEEAREITRDDGTKATLWLPEISREQDKLTSVAALVVDRGPVAYKGEDRHGVPRYPIGPWCRVGDWIMIPRQSSFLFQYKGVAMATLTDDKVMGILKDPRDVSPIYVAPRI